jgi:hypothetical protein
MQKIKIIILLMATSLVATAAIGVTYAQYFNAQNAANNQTPPQNINGNYGYLPPNNCTGIYNLNQQGYCLYGMPQGISQYQCGRMGMGMSGRNW